MIIADVLVGSAPAYHGVLPSLLGRHDGPWWLSRPAVLAGLILAVVVPTLVPRSLRVVARFSSFSVCMLFLLASAISGLALLAVAKGQVAPGVSWLPAAADIGDTPLAALSSVLTVVSGAPRRAAPGCAALRQGVHQRAALRHICSAGFLAPGCGRVPAEPPACPRLRRAAGPFPGPTLGPHAPPCPRPAVTPLA